MKMRTGTRLAALGLATTALASCAISGGMTRKIDVGSRGMEPTVKQGQIVKVTVVGKYIPHRGDIVLFKLPPTWQYEGNPCQCMLRRVIGIPGDTVSSSGMGDPVVVNGTPLSEPYLNSDDPSWMAFDVTVPPNGLWVMADNREAGIDSRVHYADDKSWAQVTDVTGVYRPS